MQATAVMRIDWVDCTRSNTHLNARITCAFEETGLFFSRQQVKSVSLWRISYWELLFDGLNGSSRAESLRWPCWTMPQKVQPGLGP